MANQYGIGVVPRRRGRIDAELEFGLWLNLNRAALRNGAEVLSGINFATAKELPRDLFLAIHDDEAEAVAMHAKHQSDVAMAAARRDSE
jgi:hypothetical protein